MSVDLFISGRSLKNLDAFSKSDPYCSVYELNTRNNSWVLKGKTERKKDNLNPDFNEKITMSYFFEKTQRLRFVMIDCDNE